MTKIFPLIQIANKLYAIDKEAEIIGSSKYLAASDSSGICRKEILNDRGIEVLLLPSNKEGFIELPEMSKDWFPIICSQDETLEIALLPNIEEDIEAIFNREPKELDLKFQSYAKGYKAAKAKQYTEKDIIKAIEMARETSPAPPHYPTHSSDKIIQSLSPIPTHVELEMDSFSQWKDDGKSHGRVETQFPKMNCNFVIVKQWHYEKQSKI